MQKELTTLFTGQHREVLGQIDSTNSYLAELLKKGRIPEGFVVRALEQLVGRGQAHAKWKSQVGKNLLLSFVFYPSFVSIPDIFQVNKAFTLGVSDLVKSCTGEDIKVKWPNDIYHSDRKIAGILLENNLNSSRIQQTILGIGMNVNQDDFPKELPNPTSLKQICGKEFDLETVLNQLCSTLEARYLQLKRGEYEALDRDFSSILYRKDQWHHFMSERVEFEGMIKGVDKRGRLLVMHRNELERFYDLKEIKFIN